MSVEIDRPLLTLHVFGSQGCGKTTLKKQWFESTHSIVLSEIADVHIRIQVSKTWVSAHYLHSIDFC